MAPEMTESLREVAERAAGVLGPESAIFEDMDAAGFGRALGKAVGAALMRPVTPVKSAVHLATNLARIPVIAGARWLGREIDPPVEVDPKDRRFAAPAWQTNPAYYSARLAYLAAAKAARDVVGSAKIEAGAKRKAEMALELLVDAMAPTNFLPGNPAALQRAFDTAGMSVLKGARQFADDLVNNGGKPRQVDSSGFEIGKNLACTPSKVVFQNDLMQLLQYEPQTGQVRANPILCSPPWINKYYIMDLAPGRSFIEWAVQHGRTVFAISYKNPTAEMSRTTMDDYLINGPQIALDVVEEITGAETIDIVGLCLGGAMTAITSAFLMQEGDNRIGTITLLNTMLDYSEPGALGAFTDMSTVERLERKMLKAGALEGETMAGTFDILRANDLIFNYVVSNWLMGQPPPAFDILAWNADSTRMPAAMHAFYLRNFYVQNKLASGELQLAGATIDLSVIKSPMYVVSAINDHIVPWQSAYKTVGLVSGPVRFVLGSGGHIAGIVSPPGPKSWHLVSDTDAALPANAEDWRGIAQRHAGTWWDDWAVWSDGNSGDLADSPRMGSAKYPVLAQGPGSYVLG